jgi:predicted DNA-binding transcriptional regulator YafY
VGGYADDDDAFRRNFERDKDVLRQMAMPLVLEPLDPLQPEGPQGYRIPRDRYELPDPGLAEDELAALHLAASAVAVEGAWGRSASTTALWKLAAAGGSDVADTKLASQVPANQAPASPGPASLGPVSPGPVSQGPAASATFAELPGGEPLAVLFGAVAARQRVRFTYHEQVREVDPWRLSYRNGQWYLAGFDHGRSDSRTYRLDRMSGPPEPIGEPEAFARPAGAVGAPPPPWLLGDEEEVVAELLVDPIQAEWATATVGAAALAERRADGSVVLKMPVTNRQAFRSFVLGFLDHAEVLGPPELRRQLMAWLSAVAGRRSSASGAAR